MEITPGTKVNDLLNRYPFLKEFLVALNPHFKALENPFMRRTMGRFADLSKVAMIGGLDLKVLMEDIAREIEKKTGEKVLAKPEEAGGAAPGAREKLETLKGIIRDLHAGAGVAELKERFKELVKDVSPSEIAEMEQELMAEGMPESEVKRLCEVHVEVFKESLAAKAVPGLPAGHPVHTFMRENREAEAIMKQIEEAGEPGRDGGRLSPLLARLSEIERHYVRKENQLFPALEAKGISGPSKVMWALHDDIRQMLKEVKARAASGEAGPTEVKALLHMVNDMIYKEEHILYPMALEALSEADWARVREGEREIGYAWVEPEEEWRPSARSFQQELLAEKVGSLNLDVGQLTAEQVNLMLTHLPIDISFVNERDEVVYYSQTPERIFPRSPGIIGRTVQNCHPPKSVGTVNKILEAFKSGRRDSAEFWIEMRGRFLHIRYFALRDDSGAYRGTIEVSQDVTGIRGLQGEKRLLDWD
ncbi:MAG: DUF438 domain-containing protein [Thermodesulfovibrionales bacterium]